MVRLRTRQRRLVGVALSIFLSAACYWLTGLSSLQQPARLALAGIAFAVVWWAFRVVPAAYCSLLLILYFLASGVGTPGQVLGFWSTSTPWLMIGAFLIAAAVGKSGLASWLSRRILLPLATGWFRLIVVVYFLNAVLAIIIPVPFPRAFILISLVKAYISQIRISTEAEAALGFAVFASCIPSSMLFLTGESILNPIVASFAGGISWMQWLLMMSVPAVAAGALMIIGHLHVSGEVFEGESDTDLMEAGACMREADVLTGEQIRTLIWVGVAVIMWVADSYHGLDPGWIAVGAAVGLSLPVIGDVLSAEELREDVDWSTLIFATAAVAIGTVGMHTGLADWLVAVLLPAGDMPLFIILGGAAAAAYVLHLVIGSVLATLSMMAGPVMALAAAAHIPAAPVMLLVYTAVVMGFALPFHNLMLLVGSGDGGHFTERETLQFFGAQTLITAVVIGIQVGWWTVLGYM